MRVSTIKKIICYIIAFILTINGLNVFSKSGNIVVHAASTYDAQAAVAYALKYAKNYNPAYASYKGYGGDCSNFVSQCLTAGGLPHDTYWNPNCPTDPKTGYNNWRQTSLKDYLIYKGYEVIWNPSPEQIIPGNPVFYSKNSDYAITHEGTAHAAICVSNTTGSNPIMAAHTKDEDNILNSDLMKYYGYKGCCTILLTRGGNSLITLWGVENNLEITEKTKLWAKRTDNDSNHYAVFYVDGEAITGHLSADQSGFFAVEIDPQKYTEGAHTFSVYYANTNGSKTDSRTIIINNSLGQSPQGAMDSIQGGYGDITLSGWAFDKDDVSKQIYCDVWIGSGSAETKVGQITANTSRPDVNTAYPGVGNNHGYSSTLNVNVTGNYDVYVYAINVGSGSDKLIGHEVVNIKPKPGSKCISEGEYYISSALTSNYYLTADSLTTDEANVYMSKNSKQKFKFTYLSDGYYMISAGTKDKVLDVYNGNQENETNITLYGWYGGSDNRKWLAKKNSDGTYTFASKCNGLVMEVNGAQAVEGANVDVWKDNGAANTKWKLISCDKKVTGISLNYSSYNLKVGGVVSLSANVSPSDATNKNVTWSTSDKNVAMVDSTGKVTAVSAGEATIKATAKDGSGNSKSCTIYVFDTDVCEHTEVIDEAVAATCTKSGLTAGKHCSRCGEVLVAQQEVKAKGHTYNQKVASNKTLKSSASYDSPAIYNYSCSCGAVGTDTFISGTALRKPDDFQNTEPQVKPISNVSVSYHTHIQSLGDSQGIKSNGEMAGTSGLAKRLENIWIKVDGNSNLGIQYSTHCQTYGWLPWTANGETNGTSGESKRLEAIKIQLTGADKDKYDVYYRVHAQSFGWLGWAKNGAPSGTAGLSKRLEGIQIVVVKKGSPAPGANYAGVNATGATYGNQAYIANSISEITIPGSASTPNVMYKTHVQTYGWQAWKINGVMSGTSGESKRLEGINIKLTNCDYTGGIQYRTHIQTYGWEKGWKSNGEMSGTSGQAKRLEAIQIQLTGEMAQHYDIYYRVHAQTYGWLGWAKNGAEAGTSGLAKRLEGIQIILVPKGQEAPGRAYQGITSVKSQAYIQK